jgi:hypothetical protein
LWATQRLLPLERGGAFAGELSQASEAARALHQRLANDGRFLVPFAPELDIVVWAIDAENASQASQRAQAVFDACAAQHLHLALVKLPASLFPDTAIDWDQETITCLRSCLMKPEHLAWLDPIWTILDQATASMYSTS